MEKLAITALNQQRDSNVELIIFGTLYFLERRHEANMVKKNYICESETGARV